MRVRHLIINIAAIPSYRSSPEGTLADWALTLNEVHLLGKPGAFWNYSNSNFALADLVVERASGMDVNDFLAVELYRPAASHGLKNAVECIFAAERGVTMPDMSEPSDTSTWRPYAGTYDAIYDDGFEFEVFVEHENGQLSMTAPNPDSPDQMVTKVLENIHASTFRFRPNSQSYWDMTFLRGKGKWAPVRWLRNSRFVGLRRLVPRRAGARLSP